MENDKTKKILIVEDEPSIVLPLKFLMEQHGFTALVAETGEVAVDILKETVPDLILLDIMLPVLNGFEVCQIIRNNSDLDNTKVIFLTAMGRDVDIAKGLALGANDYVTKPFSNSEIVEKVKGFLCD
ncbi:MAG: response regulator transcription factor [Desulfobacterales bacterium]|nr:response regulator transcription factor [Desulfobacterales bacterium]MCP4162748.1 response regulator transcription factor [Deltaproteobacteria bacterium]